MVGVQRVAVLWASPLNAALSTSLAVGNGGSGDVVYRSPQGVTMLADTTTHLASGSSQVSQQSPDDAGDAATLGDMINESDNVIPGLTLWGVPSNAPENLGAGADYIADIQSGNITGLEQEFAPFQTSSITPQPVQSLPPSTLRRMEAATNTAALAASTGAKPRSAATSAAPFALAPGMSFTPQCDGACAAGAIGSYGMTM